MRTTHRIAALACCVCWPIIAAESAQERGKRIVDEAVTALGGDAFLHMRNRIESGRAYSFDQDQLSGLSLAKIYTRYTPAGKPGKPLEEERFSLGKEEQSGFVLYLQDAGWEVTFRGARPMDEQRLADHQVALQRNIFYILRERLKEPGLSFYAQQPDIYQNRPIHIVDITDNAGVTVTVYFDQGTKLPIRQTSKIRNVEFHDFDVEVSEFSKFRDVGGGVQWPYDVRRDRNGRKIYEMYADSVEVNKDVKDDLFALSPKIKILPKAK